MAELKFLESVFLTLCMQRRKALKTVAYDASLKQCGKIKRTHRLAQNQRTVDELWI